MADKENTGTFINKSRTQKPGKNKMPRVYYVLPLMMIACSLFYYFGELIDFAGLQSLNSTFFASVHDVHRMLFLAPICYAAYVARVKGAVIITLVSFMIIMPRAFLFSPFPDPLLRAVLFIIIAGALGILTGVYRNESEKRWKLESTLFGQRSRIQQIISKMDDGVLIIGPDYKIRYANPEMEKEFGAGSDSYCYKYLCNRDAPCKTGCRLPIVLKGKVDKWEYEFTDGRVFEIIASPYTDDDGTVCQLAIYNEITGQAEQ